MTSGQMGDCCIRGVLHEGTPVGETKQFAGVEAYFSYPPDKSTEHCILYLPDAFGLELVNNKLLADSFARSGYFVVMIDYFHGDPLPASMLNSDGSKVDIMKWVGTHPPDRVEPVVNTAINELKSQYGVKRIGAVGYCFGGRYVVRQLKEGGVDAGFIAHPSLVQEEELDAARKPLSIAAAEVDNVFGQQHRWKAEEILLKNKAAFEITLYSNTEHGFAVRTDLSDRQKRFAKESAFVQAVRYFDYFVKEL